MAAAGRVVGLLVNCTPLGGAGEARRVTAAAEAVHGPLVYDLTYGSGPSRGCCARRGRPAALTLDGLPMLVAQAERQFEWWTGQRPEPGVMARRGMRRESSGSP